MITCKKCKKIIEETMEGVYPGRICAGCFSKKAGKLGLRIGRKISDKPYPISVS